MVGYKPLIDQSVLYTYEKILQNLIFTIGVILYRQLDLRIVANKLINMEIERAY